MNDSKPFVSIVIATYNEEQHIGKLLDSFSNQTYPKENFEVLVFDGLSEDNTLNIAKGYEGKLNLQVLENKKRRQVFAFNEGLKIAKGDFFMILGAHSAIDRHFLEKHYSSFLKAHSKNNRVAGVGGIHLQKKEKTMMSRIGYLFFSSPLSGASFERFNKLDGFKDTISFGFYKKDVLREVGGFDEALITGQDYEINARIRKEGYLLHQDSSISSEYSIRPNLKSFLNQVFRYAVARGIFFHMGNRNITWIVPLALIIYELLMIPTYFAFNSYVVFYPFMFYIVLLFLGSLYAIFSRRDILGLFLFPLLFITHNLAGLGFLKGLIYGKSAFNQKN